MKKQKTGFTLIEIITAMMIFAFSATGIIGLFLANLQMMTAARREMVMSMILEEVIARNQVAVHISAASVQNRQSTSFKDHFGDPSDANFGADTGAGEFWGVRNIATYDALMPDANWRWEDNDLVAGEFYFCVEDVSRETSGSNAQAYIGDKGGWRVSREFEVRDWIERQHTDFDGSGDTDGDGYVKGAGTDNTTFVRPFPGANDLADDPTGATGGRATDLQTAVPNLHNDYSATAQEVYCDIGAMWYYKRLRLTIGYDQEPVPAGGTVTRQELLENGRTQTFYFTLIANDLNKMDYPTIDPDTTTGQQYRRDNWEGRDKERGDANRHPEGFGEEPAGGSMPGRIYQPF